MHEYKATVDKVVDGDTVDLDIDLGFYVRTRQRCRLLGYDAPEKFGPEKERGDAAKRHLQVLLSEPGELFVRTAKTEKYGRWLAQVELIDGGKATNINEAMKAFCDAN